MLLFFTLKVQVSKVSPCLPLHHLRDGHISVCPATTVTLTCTASGQEFLTWRQVTDIHTFIASDYETEEKKIVQRGPYTLTPSDSRQCDGSYC